MGVYKAVMYVVADCCWVKRVEVAGSKQEGCRAFLLSDNQYRDRLGEDG